jgi:hypothetical protein
MNLNRVLTKTNVGIIAAIAVLVVIAPVGYSLTRFGVGQATQIPQVFLEMPDSQYQECVRETTYMRFHHMDLLKQTREEFIRDGIRGEVTLSGCRDCHENRDRFCNQCHDAASLTLDCFGCHYYPESGEELQHIGT